MAASSLALSDRGRPRFNPEVLKPFSVPKKTTLARVLVTRVIPRLDLDIPRTMRRNLRSTWRHFLVSSAAASGALHSVRSARAHHAPRAAYAPCPPTPLDAYASSSSRSRSSRARPRRRAPSKNPTSHHRADRATFSSRRRPPVGPPSRLIPSASTPSSTAAMSSSPSRSPRATRACASATTASSSRHSRRTKNSSTPPARISPLPRPRAPTTTGATRNPGA